MRNALLSSASQLVDELGWAAFTFREVARRAGVSHNAPYRHFKSKEDLLASLATTGFRQLQADSESALAGMHDPLERLREAARTYLRFAFAGRARFHLMFHAVFDRQSYPDYVAAYRDSLAFLAALLEGIQHETLGVNVAGELIWASVHGIAELGLEGRLLEGGPDALTLLVDRMVDTLLAGMRTVKDAALHGP